MAVDEATKKQDALELYQIDDKAIVPFFKAHLDELRKFLQEHKGEDLSLLVKLKQFIRTYRLPFNMQRYMEVQRTYIQQSLQNQIQDRQSAVSHWIQEHACRHRNASRIRLSPKFKPCWSVGSKNSKGNPKKTSRRAKRTAHFSILYPKFKDLTWRPG